MANLPNTNSLIQIVNDHENKLADNAISPESYSGNALQKVTSAITDAIANRKAVKFNKMYDITGLGKIIINKAVDVGDRRILYLIGDGGGIIKNDAGYVFDAPAADVGDINISKVRFESTVGAGTKIWNNNNIIRLTSHDCEYYNVDTIGEADNRYYQSVRFIKEHIVGGKGWAFSFKESYDTTIDNCLFENREHGIRNPVALTILCNRNLRITKNVIENLSGTAIQLANTWGCTIGPNYLEANNVNIDLQTLVTGYLPHYGLTVIGNMITLTNAQLTASAAAILVGDLNNSADTTLGANKANQVNNFIGNTSNGILFNKNGIGYIIGIGNYGGGNLANINVKEWMLSGLNREQNSRVSGISRALKYTASVTFAANEEKIVTQACNSSLFYFPVKDEDMVQVYVDKPDKISILAINPSHISVNNGQIVVALKNRDTVNPVTANLTFVIYKIYD